MFIIKLRTMVCCRLRIGEHIEKTSYLNFLDRWYMKIIHEIWEDYIQLQNYFCALHTTEYCYKLATSAKFLKLLTRIRCIGAWSPRPGMRHETKVHKYKIYLCKYIAETQYNTFVLHIFHVSLETNDSFVSQEHVLRINQAECKITWQFNNIANELKYYVRKLHNYNYYRK